RSPDPALRACGPDGAGVFPLLLLIGRADPRLLPRRRRLGGMPKSIGRDEVQRLVASGAQLAEVLPKDEYEDEHLPGAIHLPLRRVEKEARQVLDATRPVIVYCHD